MQQYANTCSVMTCTFNLWGGSKVETFFSEASHFEYRLIGMKHRASYKHIMFLHKPWAPRVGSKDQFFFSENTVSCCISN